MKKMTRLEKVIKYATKFKNEQCALNRFNTTLKPRRLVLGDNNEYWLVTPAEAELLVKNGYEHYQF